MSKHPTIKSVSTWWVELHMAGSVELAGHVIQRHVIEFPTCVTLTPQSFIYTGGREEGFCIGFVNYPRFPHANVSHLTDEAYRLAHVLLEELGQHSFLMMTPEDTVWYSRRESAA